MIVEPCGNTQIVSRSPHRYDFPPNFAGRFAIERLIQVGPRVGRQTVSCDRDGSRREVGHVQSSTSLSPPRAAPDRLRRGAGLWRAARPRFISGRWSASLAVCRCRRYARCRSGHGWLGCRLRVWRRPTSIGCTLGCRKSARTPCMTGYSGVIPARGGLHRRWAEQIWAIHDEVPDHLRVAVLLGAFAELRIAEVCGLQTADVDFIRGVVHPKLQWTNRDGPARLVPLKTEGSSQPIPIPRDLA